MPHFMALAWLCKDDYARGGFRMLPAIDPSGRRTAGVALRHTAALLPLGAVAVALQVGRRRGGVVACAFVCVFVGGGGRGGSGTAWHGVAWRGVV
jgi:heme O synthase-like polyprenyltransferase